MSARRSPPKLSVSVLSYNYGNFLGHCLESILHGDFTDLELFVINDCSTDDTLAVAARYASDPRVTIVDHDVNRGFVESLVEGAALTTGEYLTVVSADDWVADPSAFSRQIAALDAHPTAAVACSAFGVWSSETERVGVVHPFDGDRVLTADEFLAGVLLNKALHHSGTVVRHSAYRRVGGYDASKRYAIDTDMWARLATVGGAVYLDEPLHAYRQHGNNMTGKPDTVRRSIAEKLDTIDAVAGRASGRAVRSAALRRATSEWTMWHAFELGRLDTAWSFWWAAFRLRPVATVMQLNTVRLAARTALGRRGYAATGRVATRVLKMTGRR